MHSVKNRFTALLLSVLLAFSLASCSFGKEKKEYTAEEANAFLTEFFSDYTSMCDYLTDDNIAISAFALDGAGLSAILRALYQSQSVTYAFSEPVMTEPGVFQSNVTIFAPDMIPLFSLYTIDKEILEISGEVPDEDFVAEIFYSNLSDNMNDPISTTVTVTVRVSDLGEWSVDFDNVLAEAILPNIRQV